ncbi:thioredoxin-disulfide reductase [Enterobacteriaceae endosymbiont of Plateumaris pusilla]|uniref:thioredoxin-disulfide reductase n=1 Tax=Enterobacteriaceae endosymbiont of Plateumaris pusilla TaxID=2675795 RepID=UPI001449CD92|nr:thioredoxin-disulfide reductase [Enterobacteriaceae endosymbiont of Plateumaris pusilla]QJC29733.1 thioredoxin-disulfide reductase [Enterobacteriaceae endosymbiont of Plateumaris pusilla]
MNNIQHTKLLILGSGPAGYTAAIYSARANLNPILITGIDIGGQLTKTTNVENWPGNFPNISGNKLMDNLHNHALYFKTNIINDYILKVDLKQKPFFLTGNFFKYTCDSLIIATGAVPKFLGLDSEKKFIGKGISSCAICDGSFYYNRKIAVIGGGNTAIEEALYLSNIASEVHLIHRKSYFSAEKILINKLLDKVKNNNIILHNPYIVKEILGNQFGVTGIKIFSSTNIENYKIINLYGIFISIGTIPNTNLFKNLLKLDNNGYIITNHISKNKFNFTQTSISGIFAAGDVMDNVYRQAITSAATGCMAAVDAQNYLRKNF